jgi:glycosyltransferase involved in cell wall biosynthesis
MSIAFLIPTPPPVLAAAEAYAQEIEALKSRFGGRVFYINPNRFLPRHLPLQLPRPCFGLHNLPLLLLAGSRHRIYQLYSPSLYPYPMLSLLRRPVVFTLTGRAGDDPVRADAFRRFAAVTVPDPESLERLRSAGLTNVRLVRAGVDIRRFSSHPLPVGKEIRLLMASAPWTREQFASKGIDALLDAAAREPRLHLTLLGRGVLTQEIRDRVRERDLGGRVEVVDRLADVDRVLAGVHATVNLAGRGDVVKAYPHSLMESLVAGKPVLVSRAIPMPAYVEVKGVGAVVERVSAEGVLAALGELLDAYAERSRRALELGRRDFALAAMTESFEKVYSEIPSWPTRPAGSSEDETAEER